MNIKYNKPFRVLDMKLIQVGKTNMYDVFDETRLGWEHLARVVVYKEKIIELVKKPSHAKLSNIQKFAILKSVK